MNRMAWTGIFLSSLTTFTFAEESVVRLVVTGQNAPGEQYRSFGNEKDPMAAYGQQLDEIISSASTGKLSPVELTAKSLPTIHPVEVSPVVTVMEVLNKVNDVLEGDEDAQSRGKKPIPGDCRRAAGFDYDDGANACKAVSGTSGHYRTDAKRVNIRWDSKQVFVLYDLSLVCGYSDRTTPITMTLRNKSDSVPCGQRRRTS